MDIDTPRRRIRSFVRREGRLTPGQQKALDNHWPKYGLDTEGSVLDLSSVFHREAPTVLEIGFGNGASLAAMAMAAPEKNFIGIEVHRPGVGQLLKQTAESGLDNVRVVSSDAVQFLDNRIADGSLSRVQVYFPDPWHKKRHHKRRLIQPEFVAHLAEKLHSGGELHLATDWQNYAEHMLEVMTAAEMFDNCSDSGAFIPRPEYRPETKFEQRGQRKGHGVWDLLFQRR